VLGRENRPVDDQRFAELKERAFAAWLIETRTQADIETFDIWQENVPTEPTLQ
jgi:hypothetical protein